MIISRMLEGFFYSIQFKKKRQQQLPKQNEKRTQQNLTSAFNDLL